jgi:hypothetical protein
MIRSAIAGAIGMATGITGRGSAKGALERGSVGGSAVIAIG